MLQEFYRVQFFVFRCEFASRNPGGCQSNQYYTPIEPIPVVPGSQLSTGNDVLL